MSWITNWQNRTNEKKLVANDLQIRGTGLPSTVQINHGVIVKLDLSDVHSTSQAEGWR